jgi:hypothetical protein
MPQLLALVACEKVLIDSAGNPTLVVVMERIEVELPEGTSFQENIAAPKEWAVFTIWKLKEDESPGQNYRHVTEIVAPGKDTPRQKITADFQFKDKIHKVHHNMFGIPVGAEGTIFAKVWLELPGGPIVTDVYSYPVQIIYKIAKA